MPSHASTRLSERDAGPTMSAMREFEWSFNLGLFAGAAAIALGVVLTVGALFLLGRALRRHRRSK